MRLCLHKWRRLWGDELEAVKRRCRPVWVDQGNWIHTAFFRECGKCGQIQRLCYYGKMGESWVRVRTAEVKV